MDEISSVFIDLNEKNFKYLEDLDQPLDKRHILDLASLYNFKPSFIFRSSVKDEKIVQDAKPQQVYFIKKFIVFIYFKIYYKISVSIF